jgi:hypothetical protein
MRAASRAMSSSVGLMTSSMNQAFLVAKRAYRSEPY